MASTLRRALVGGLARARPPETLSCAGRGGLVVKVSDGTAAPRTMVWGLAATITVLGRTTERMVKVAST